jgi:SHS2 domain-containing protein
MNTGRWQHFHHQADIGIRGIATSLEEAFVQAALALTAVVTDPDTVRPRTEVRIGVQAPEPELLLVDWLNALVYEMSSRQMLFSHFDLEIEGQRLRASAFGETVDRKRHHPTVEVKAATYTSLRVRREKDGLWIAQCVVDV